MFSTFVKFVLHTYSAARFLSQRKTPASSSSIHWRAGAEDQPVEITGRGGPHGMEISVGNGGIP